MKLSSVFMLVAVLVAAPLAAKEAPSAKDAAYARKVMRDFARCVIEREPKLARQFVLMQPGESLSDEDFKAVFDHRCLGLLGGKLKMRRFQYRGAVADELIRRELPSPTISFAALPPLAWATFSPRSDFESATAERNYNLDVAESLIGRLGECVVRTDPAGSRRVLATKWDDAAELQAFKAIGPHIAGCISRGQTLSFNRTNLRNAMAISYYRLANAMGTGVAGQ